MNKYLIIGQGSVGSKVSNELASSGLKVTGMARGNRNQYDLLKSVEYIQQDAKKLTREQLVDFTHIVIIVSPDRYCTEGYTDSYLAIAEHISTLSVSLTKLQRIIFISSTGIYGQNNGEWIDEDTIPKLPTRKGSQIILQAEATLQQSYDNKLIVIRPSGIYGKQRLMRIKKAQENVKEPISDNSWTNRIMDTDLVHIICQVLKTDQPKPIYLATDYQPVTSYDLMIWLCEKLETSKPELVKNAPTGKRIHSNVPVDWLKFPDWKTGYQEILTQLTYNKK